MLFIINENVGNFPPVRRTFFPHNGMKVRHYPPPPQILLKAHNKYIIEIIGIFFINRYL